MTVMRPLPESEGFDPLDLVDPTLADRPYRRDPAPDGRPSPAVDLPPAPLAVPARMAGCADLFSAYASGTLTPAAVLCDLAAAAAVDPSGAEAILCLAPDAAELARDSERRWREGRPRPLEGLPFAIKDIIDVAGAKVTSGSLFTGERIAARDADAVARLRAAGAIPYAMTATTEFACGSPHNPRHGTVTNPWDATRWTGGSSTGSGAALAARLLPFALGTDTGGSIRVPSCWCGTTGLKPSRERVSRAGVAPLSWTLDHVGPMTRSARDIALVLPHMVAEPDATLAARCAALVTGVPDIAGLRVGVPSSWFTEMVSAPVLANWRASLGVLEGLGAVLVDLPPLDVAPLHEAGWTILLSELAAHHEARHPQGHLFDKGLLARLEQGMRITAGAYGRALATRLYAQDVFLSAMERAGADLIATPGLGGEAGDLAALTVDIDGVAHGFQHVLSRNTMIFDLTGFPALMLPSGRGASGLPTGLQIVGRPGDDALCLGAGVAFQSATAHHTMLPPRLAP